MNVKENYINTSQIIKEQTFLPPPITFPQSFAHIASPVYPDDKGHYIWYKHSAPEPIDTRIIEDEHMLLYQSDSPVEVKQRESVYVKVYLVCLVFMILMLLVLPFLSWYKG